MVSPRKALKSGLHKGPQPTGVGDQSKSKSRKSVKHVFAKKKFFIDVKTKTTPNSQIRKIIEDIQTLGGTVEEFFSKDVTTVISDAPIWRLKQPATPTTPSPGTPHLNSSFSPATSIESQDSKRRSVRRVDSILEKARRANKGGGDVIDNAQKWGQQVWSLGKFLSWFETFKNQNYPLKKPRSQSVDNQHKALATPYIKFEVTSHQFRPAYHELKTWPQLHFTGRPGSSPFIEPDPKPVNRSSTINRLVDRDPHKDTHKKKLKVVSPKSRTRRHSGYCEICEENFSDLDNHLTSGSHQQLIVQENLWKSLDQCLDKTNWNLF